MEVKKVSYDSFLNLSTSYFEKDSIAPVFSIAPYDHVKNTLNKCSMPYCEEDATRFKDYHSSSCSKCSTKRKKKKTLSTTTTTTNIATTCGEIEPELNFAKCVELGCLFPCHKLCEKHFQIFIFRCDTISAIECIVPGCFHTNLFEHSDFKKSFEKTPEINKLIFILQDRFTIDFKPNGFDVTVFINYFETKRIGLNICGVKERSLINHLSEPFEGTKQYANIWMTKISIPDFGDLKSNHQNDQKSKPAKTIVCLAEDTNIQKLPLKEIADELFEYIVNNSIEACFFSCFRGISRSCAALLAFMILHCRTDTGEVFTTTSALALVKQFRPIVNPNRGFMDQLNQLELLS